MEISKPEATTDAAAEQFAANVPAPQHAAWEEVDTGRFMPRRVRGSYQGRALG